MYTAGADHGVTRTSLRKRTGRSGTDKRARMTETRARAKETSDAERIRQMRQQDVRSKRVLGVRILQNALHQR